MNEPEPHAKDNPVTDKNTVPSEPGPPTAEQQPQTPDDSDAESVGLAEDPHSESAPGAERATNESKSAAKLSQKRRRRNYASLLVNQLMQALSLYVLFTVFSSAEQPFLTSLQLYLLLGMWNLVVLGYLLSVVQAIRKRRQREDRGAKSKFLDPWGDTKLGRISRFWAPSVTSAVGLLAGVLVILTVPTGSELTAMMADVQRTGYSDLHRLVDLQYPNSEFALFLKDLSPQIAVDIQRTWLVIQKGVGVATVFLAWVLFHVNFAQLYAWMFRYGLPGGLEFPKTEQPNDVDFMYYSFTIGTTFAVSDVSTTSTEMRWHSIQHAVASFFYNAIVLAIAIKLLTS